MRLAGVLLAMGLFVACGAAQADGSGPRALGAEAAPWQAVGRIDIDDKGFCTGTLIAPDLVLTAAHCLFDRATGTPVDPSRIHFQAGFRNGWSAASSDARRAVAHPRYVFNPSAGAAESRFDLALIELAQPILGQVPVFETAAEPDPGSTVSIVSYAVGRSEAPSREDACDVLGAERGVYILGCEVDFGASGSPVFRLDGGVARIVSVVSAKGELRGQRVALGTSLTEPLAELRATLAAADTTPSRPSRPPAAGTDPAAGASVFLAVRGDLNAGAGLPR